jgi:5-methylcytosine-specific restriction enzyme B
MSYADQVRKHCNEKYVTPARVKGQAEITIRAGDVHHDLGFASRMPGVCGAIGSKRFEDECNLKRVSVDGPLQGATTTFTFKVL